MDNDDEKSSDESLQQFISRCSSVGLSDLEGDLEDLFLENEGLKYEIDIQSLSWSGEFEYFVMCFMGNHTMCEFTLKDSYTKNIKTISEFYMMLSYKIKETPIKSTFDE